MYNRGLVRLTDRVDVDYLALADENGLNPITASRLNNRFSMPRIAGDRHTTNRFTDHRFTECRRLDSGAFILYSAYGGVRWHIVATKRAIHH